MTLYTHIASIDTGPVLTADAHMQVFFDGRLIRGVVREEGVLLVDPPLLALLGWDDVHFALAHYVRCATWREEEKVSMT